MALERRQRGIKCLRASPDSTEAIETRKKTRHKSMRRVFWNSRHIAEAMGTQQSGGDRHHFLGAATKRHADQAEADNHQRPHFRFRNAIDQRRRIR